MLVPSAEARLRTLRLDVRVSIQVTGDHTRIRQVLINLIGNAVKFTPERGVITVEAGTSTALGAAWGEIRVTDTGSGIAPDELAAIFEPYYRSETTAHAPGVGLGLAISRALVTHMGGTLDVESEPGAGSTFIVRFPVSAGV
jgi:signal transduction histidine kinase